MNSKDQVFVQDQDTPWEEIAPGIRRKIMTWDQELMLVKVVFEKGAVGALHSHPHVQISHIESGAFEVEINGDRKVLQSGDAFHVPSNAIHGVVCIEPGVLIDVFTPMREDFLTAER